jgi:hypothetical protein
MAGVRWRFTQTNKPGDDVSVRARCDGIARVEGSVAFTAGRTSL